MLEMSFPYDPKLKERAKELRKNMTPWERKLWYEFLRGYRPRFQRQKMIGQHIVDFYCPEARLAIELDGSQHYTEEKRKADDLRTREIQKYKVQMIRFTNTDVMNHFTSVCETIHQEVNGRLKKPPSEEGGGAGEAGDGGSEDLCSFAK